MNLDVELLIEGEPFTQHGREKYYPLKYIPNVGDTIIYKTFRSNPSYKKEKKDYLLKVHGVVHEIEEDWNGTFKNKVLVHVSVIEVKTVE